MPDPIETQEIEYVSRETTAAQVPPGPLVHEHQLVGTLFDALMTQIAEFEKGLAGDEELGACLTHFGREVTITVAEVSHRSPALIIFRGTTSAGQRVTLLQHQSQVNVLLTAIKVKPGQSPRRIGFQPDAHEP